MPFFLYFLLSFWSQLSVEEELIGPKSVRHKAIHGYRIFQAFAILFYRRKNSYCIEIYFSFYRRGKEWHKPTSSFFFACSHLPQWKVGWSRWQKADRNWCEEFLPGGRIRASYLARMGGPYHITRRHTRAIPLVAKNCVEYFFLNPALVWRCRWFRWARWSWWSFPSNLRFSKGTPFVRKRG